jgi:hypothetical protein
LSRAQIELQLSSSLVKLCLFALVERTTDLSLQADPSCEGSIVAAVLAGLRLIRRGHH